MKLVNICLLAAGVLVLQGCATSRSIISPDAPSAPAAAAAYHGTVYIGTVTDNRIFEAAPSEASTPSLRGPVDAVTAAQTQPRAIGRKRNGYGKALGDVLLPEGESVANLIRQHAVVAFDEAGWRVVQSPDADHKVDIRIDEFWAWFRPGFSAITLSANVKTLLTFSSQLGEVTVGINAEDRRQLATEGAWKEIIEQALAEYRRKFVELMAARQ